MVTLPRKPQGRGPEGNGSALQTFTLLGLSTFIAVAGHNLDNAGILSGHLGDGSYVPAVASVARIFSLVTTHRKHPLPEVLSALVLGAGFEAAQTAHIVPGQGDLLDSFAYIAGGATYLGLNALVSRAFPEHPRR